jgi:hypothetical protein
VVGGFVLGVALVLVAVAGQQDDETGAPATTTTVAPPQYEADGTVLEQAGQGPELCVGGILDSLPPQCGGPPVAGWDWDHAPGAEQSGTTRWADVHVVGTFDGETFTITEPPTVVHRVDGGADVPDFSPACEDPSGDLSRTSGDALALTSGANAAAIPSVPGQVAMWVTATGPGPFVVNYVVQPGNSAAAAAQVTAVWDGGLCVVERDAPTEAELRSIQAEVTESTSDGSTPLGSVLGVGADTVDGFVDVELLVVTPDATAYAHDRWGDLVHLAGALQPVDGN